MMTFMNSSRARTMSGPTLFWRRNGAEENTMKHSYRSLGLALLLSIALPAAVQSAASAAEAHQAKVVLADARAKALSIVPGKVVDEELEHEGGRWIYSFEIKPTGETRKLIREVNIDADTGVVVGLETERG